MGNLHSMESAEMVSNGQMDIDTALTYQLQSNHYPPVSIDFIPSCKKAIQLVQQGIDEENPKLYDTIVKLPNGKSLSASKIVEGLHLEFFLNNCEE